MSLNHILVSRLTIMVLLLPAINATNSEVLPEPGLTYSNIFDLYSFEKLKGPDGESDHFLTNTEIVKEAKAGKRVNKTVRTDSTTSLHYSLGLNNFFRDAANAEPRVIDIT